MSAFGTDADIGAPADVVDVELAEPASEPAAAPIDSQPHPLTAPAEPQLNLGHHAPPAAGKKSRGKTLMIFGGICVAIVLIVLMSVVLRQGPGGERMKKSPDAPEPAPPAPVVNNFRLPGEAIPTAYRISLDTHLYPQFVFSGVAEIDVNVPSPTPRITLHQKDLTIGTVYVQSGDQRLTAQISMDGVKEFLILDLPRAVSGECTIHIEFDGVVLDALAGFYRSSYRDESGNTQWIGTTHFEPTDARRAFPCFDEPSLKANFTMTITTAKGFTALSNMNLVSQQDNTAGTRTTFKFAPSVKMSTYLVCYVVSKFGYLEDTSTGIPIRVYARKGHEWRAAFALQVAKQVVPFFGSYFDTPYPLPKLDLIAIPDFAAGAMENWGLITFRETALLEDADGATNNVTTSSRRWIAQVVSHELGHSWFGDLVTMKWWDDLWLNEGFATYTEFLAVNYLFPTWNMWSQFLLDERAAALHLDSLWNSHPIQQVVNSPGQINGLFDSISYSKGASVIRMVASFMDSKAPNNFRTGIQKYLKKYKFSNAGTNDLWQALEDHSGLPIVQMMTTWTSQKGYPVISVASSPTTTSIAQRQFLLDLGKPRYPLPSDPAQISDEDILPLGFNVTDFDAIKPDPLLHGSKWYVPVTLLTSGGTPRTDVIKNSQETLGGLPGVPSGQWVLCNSGQAGLYRCKYDAANWQLLTSALRATPNSFVKRDRIGILDLAFALAKSGLLNSTVALNMLKPGAVWPHAETDTFVWDQISSMIGTWGRFLVDSACYPQFQQFAKALYSTQVSLVGWTVNPGESFLLTERRQNILAGAVAYGDSGAVTSAVALFDGLVANPSNNTIPVSLRGIVYAAGVGKYGYSAWKFMQDRYRSVSDATEKRRCMGALASATHPSLLQAALEMSLSSDVKAQDAAILIEYVAGNSAYGRQIAWDFVRNRWSDLAALYGSGSFTIQRLIQRVTGKFHDVPHFVDVRMMMAEFYRQTPLAGGYRAFRQTLELIENNIAWKRTIEPDVCRWLKANYN